MKNSVSRYSFRQPPPTDSGRRIGGIILVSAVIVALITQSLAGVLLSTAVALIGAFFLLRPRRPEFYVEVAPESLVIHLLWSTKIKLTDISAVDLHSFEYPPVVIAFLNLFILTGRVFGGRDELMTAEGDPSNVIVRFSGWKFVFTIFPPFIFPRRNWVLAVEDPVLFQHDLKASIDALEAESSEARPS